MPNNLTKETNMPKSIKKRQIYKLKTGDKATEKDSPKRKGVVSGFNTMGWDGSKDRYDKFYRVAFERNLDEIDSRIVKKIARQLLSLSTLSNKKEEA